jgi:hypothetical protein
MPMKNTLISRRIRKKRAEKKINCSPKTAIQLGSTDLILCDEKAKK